MQAYGREKMMADFLRHDIENQPPEVRRHNFEEVSLGFSDDVAKKEADRKSVV